MKIRKTNTALEQLRQEQEKLITAQTAHQDAWSGAIQGELQGDPSRTASSKARK